MMRHKDRQYRRMALAGIIMAGATGTNPAAIAQGGELMLEEVVVTAQKREQSIQDVPGSVAAFSSEMLAKSNTRNFDELNNIASGINITSSSDGFGSVIRIRGVGNNSFVPAIRPSVGIFLDDIPLGSSEAAYSNMADIERVEVLKGPQATLFGKEVSSGAIVLTTRRPDPQAADAYVEGNFGNLGLQEYRLGGNLPLGDQFALRASGYINDRDGAVENTVSGEDGSERDAEGYRLRLLWEPTDFFSATLGYEDHDIEVTGTNSVAQEYGDLWANWEAGVEGITDPADSLLTPFDLDDRKNAHALPTLRNTETTILSLHIDWAINDYWTLTSVTGDQEYELNTIGLNDTGLVDPDGNPLPPSFGSSIGPYAITNTLQNRSNDAFSQELRLTFERDRWSSIIGGFYAENDLSSIVDFNQLALQLGGLSIFAPGLSYITDDTTEWAIFTHNIYSIREGLDLTVGVRYSEVEKDAVKGQMLGAGAFGFLGHPQVPPAPWDQNDPALKQNDTWDEFTGTVKLTWWLTDEMSVYGGWDRGFKAGGHNVCKGTDPEPFCPDPFDSETADNFEVGMKGRFLDNTLSLNAAAYHQTYDDYQVEIQDDVGIGNSVVNAAEVEIQGVEMDFQWLTGPHLLLDGNISYVDARWDTYEDAGCLRVQYSAVACSPNADGKLVQDLSGKRLNYTSPWSANVNATWSDQFSNGLYWYIRGEYAFREDRLFFPDLDPAVTDGSYSLFNASVGISGENENWDVILWAKNILDEDYVNSADRNRDNTQFVVPGVTPAEGYRMTAGLERTYGMTVKYRFEGS